MTPFPTLYTPRLTLRKLEVEDFPALIKHINHPEIEANIVNVKLPFREPEASFRLMNIAKAIKHGSRFPFIIFSDEDQELIGEISLSRMDKNEKQGQLAYWIGKNHWSKGYASESVQALLQFGFHELNLEMISGDCYDYNMGSQKVLTKNHMSYRQKTGRIQLYSIDKNTFTQKNINEPNI